MEHQRSTFRNPLVTPHGVSYADAFERYRWTYLRGSGLLQSSATHTNSSVTMPQVAAAFLEGYREA